MILLLLLIFCVSAGKTDTAVQTDWAGGDGLQGPVTDWGDSFYQGWYVDWSGYPGDLWLLSHPEVSVASEYDGADNAYASDIDGDGDMDIMASSYWDDNIIWWENLNYIGTAWSGHTVANNQQNVDGLQAEDIDDDGDMDILAAVSLTDNISWWENSDGVGTSWVLHTVDDNYNMPSCIQAADVNNDGYMDIVSSSGWDDLVTWWENDDGTGVAWTEHNVDSLFRGWEVSVGDVNGDGDLDIVGVSKYNDEISWWENEDGSGTIWTKHQIEPDIESPTSCCIADVDSDGDEDVLGTRDIANEVIWWENKNGLGTSWAVHYIDTDFYSATAICSADFDNDGDVDVLAGGYYSNVNLYLNDGSGSSWTKHCIDDAFAGTVSVVAADVDNDGNIDAVAAAILGDQISWWDLTPVGWVKSSIFNTEAIPDWGYLEWTSQTPTGSAVSIQVRASDDYTVMGAWSDFITSPCSLEGILGDGDRYLQYRVILESVLPFSAPVLFEISISWDQQGIGGDDSLPATVLMPFAPNPTRFPEARFSLSASAHARIDIFDITGRLVRSIENDYSAGLHTVPLVGLSGGSYLCRILSDEIEAVRHFVVLN